MAARCVEKVNRQPNLTLSDTMMPEVDGYAACSLIKADQATKIYP